MTFSWRWDVSDAFELRPRVCVGIIRPHIIEPGHAVGAAEAENALLACRPDPEKAAHLQIQSITPGDHGVICPRGWYLSMWWTTVDCVLYKNLPPITGLLKRIQIKCDQIVEKVSLNLPTKYVDLAAQDVQSVAVSSRRSLTSWECS